VGTGACVPEFEAFAIEAIAIPIDSYQGMPSGMPEDASNFSEAASAANARPQRLKPRVNRDRYGIAQSDAPIRIGFAR
jgi:hypothetical protein